MQYSFNLIMHNGMNQFIQSDVNLLEMYKAAIASGSSVVTWEKGVINLTQIVGIIDNTVRPLEVKKNA